MFLSKISLTSRKNIPYPVDWTSTSTDTGEGAIQATTNTQTISGIGAPITIKLQFSTSSGSTDTMSYSLNSLSYTVFSNDETLTINNGNSLSFRRTTSTQAGSVTTLSIINVSNGNSTMDTVAMNAFI
jgi:hypothetical protein